MDQTTFADVIQKSFIAMSMGATDNITTINIVANMSMSFLVGMFIFFIYKKTYQGVLYQRSFNISLVLACTVTSMVIMTISGNLILSLGMVGALSIVRFRTPVKDSIDLIFLFWAIAAGIANGVAFYNISIAGSALIALFMLLLTHRKAAGGDAYLVVLQLTNTSDEKAILDFIKESTLKSSMKSKSIRGDASELTLEVKTKSNDTGFASDVKNKFNLPSVTLVAFDQDLVSA